MPGSGTLTVAGLYAEVTLDRVVEADLASLATVRHCETGDALLGLIAARQVDAAVIGLLDPAGASVAPLIAKAREQDPGLRIVVDVPAVPSALQQVPAVFRAGASEAALQGHDRLGEMIRTVLVPDWQPGAGMALLDTVPEMVPESLKAFAIACALKGSPRLTVEMVADWVRTSPRTVRSRFRRASLASPLTFIRYCSAAHAMCLLHSQRLHPDRVVERLRFGTRRALNDLIQDYTDDSAEAVPERWAYAALLLQAEEFLRREAARRSSNVRFVELLDRYMARELTTEEGLRFERWLVRGGTAVASALEEMRRSWDHPGMGRELRQRREETWVRLLRSLGSGLEP
ncbi:MAG: hypothetical protein ACREMX_17185 [Gemmatimonadales bacterium]